MSQQNHKKTGIVSSVIVSLVFLAITFVVITNRQQIIDQVVVWNFKPSSTISGLADRAGLNSNGKFYYFASQPKLDGTSAFNSECDRVEKVTSILGCYKDYRIYVYDVNDEQLDGIREVTATHETLHAIYDRLSEVEKTKVNKLLEVEYKKLSTDKDFAEVMAFYARTEPGQRDNELHSIIGTEVRTISTELEDHYKKYFSDRQKVVDLNAKYSSVFKSLKDRADVLSSELDALSATITTQSSQYNTGVTDLNADISSFNTRANTSDFSSQYQFDVERDSLTQRLASLQAIRDDIDNKVIQYKTLLDEYNSLASQSKKLYSVIDSTLAPAPTVE